eukprot:297916_1
MSTLTLNISVLFVTGALFILYWTLSREHFRKQLKKPNDITVHVPLPHLQQSYRKKTIYGKIRCRQFTFTSKSNNTNNNNTIWIIFIPGHGDCLDIYDTLINQLYEKLISNPLKKGINKINMIPYDRIGYGASSSFNYVNGNKICITPPTFRPITAHDRAIELLSFLMNIEIDNCKFKLFTDELILIGHSYGGLIAQSLLNVFTNDLKIYYPDISFGTFNTNIKLFLMDSSWIDMDKVIGKFEVNKIDCYKDYFQTMFGLQSPMMFYKYPSYNYLKQINTNYENEIVNNIQICIYYRALGSQLIAQWNESMGFWDSMSFCGKNIEEWTQKINNMEHMHNITVQIYNLYSSSMNMSQSMEQVNQQWKIFQERLSNNIDSKYLIRNECVDCHHYIYLEKPDIVTNRILTLINS